MEEAQQSGQDMDNLAGDVLDSMGVSTDETENLESDNESKSQEENADPLYVQKRLKQQKRTHERESRELRARISELEARTAPMQNNDQQSDPYADHQSPTDGSNIAEHIHKAVSYALGQKERDERKTKEAQRVAHINEQYKELHKHLDKVSDKYDDFDDVVRGEHTPYTTHMRDASLLLPKTGNGSAGEVLYSIGKNPTELKRISELHPLDQAAEIVRLSHALMSGGDKKTSQQTRPLGQIKSNPVTNSASVTDKTSVAELRKRMKTGRKWA